MIKAGHILGSRKTVAVTILAAVCLLILTFAVNSLLFKDKKPDHVAVLAARTSNFQLTIKRVDTVSFDNTAKTKRISVETQLKNTGPNILQISPGLQMFVIDQYGSRYSATAKYLPIGVVVGGPLNSNTSRTQSIDFELPTNSTPRSFIFQLDSSSPLTSIVL